MNWIALNDIKQIEEIAQRSFEKSQVIFKHSTRCSISSMILGRIDRDDILPNVDFYYLDLLRYKDVSNSIEAFFNIAHESPQILLIQDGKCTYHESHYGITMDEIAERL